MNRHTLNGLQPRTVADSTRDPNDWLDYRLRGNVVRFVGHLQPDAMERLEQRKTMQVRRLHDSAMESMAESMIRRLLAWIGRWC